MHDKKIVITGGAGFIGSTIAGLWLQKNAKVVVIDNLRTGKLSNLDGLDVEFIQQSVTNSEIVDAVCKDADIVYHLASMVSVPESFDNPAECFSINTMGLLHIAGSLMKSGNSGRIVYSSSAAVYGNCANLPLKTTEATIPLSPYGVAKLSGEQLLQTLYKEMELKSVSLRYFNVYGPKQDPKGAYASVIPLFIMRALQNEDILIFGNGEQVRDFVFVGDVAQANYLASHSNSDKTVFNVASGSVVTLNQLAEIIIRLTNSKSRIVYKEPRKGDILLSSADISDTRDALGYSPATHLEDGLSQTIAYFRKTYFGN